MGKGRYIAAGLVVPLVAAAGVVWFTRTEGSPEETAAAYLSAWGRRDYPAMKALVAEPPADFVPWHRGLPKMTIEAGADGAFTARVGTLSYTHKLTLIEHDRTWKVSWTPATIQPDLKPGRRLRLLTSQEKVPILSATGARIDTGDVPGSVQQIVAGLKDEDGGASSSRLAVYQGDRLVRTLAATSVKNRPSIRTTLDLRVHRAGARALEDVDAPASLVALRSSTGEILAVVNNRGGFDRALMGKYPPGSTFKVVTASALVADGVSAEQTVQCPAEQNIGGFPFHNAKFRDYGTLPFRDAFAHSCNTTFGAMTVADLGASRLAKVAGDFGFGVPINPGVPAVRADFPAPKDATDLASASIGQGRVLASPLNMAAVAAAIADGTWRPPRLLPADLLADQPATRTLEPPVLKALRSLMPAVVTEGTAHSVPFPDGTAGKTGTAEYGSGAEPPSHAWFIGYRGDLAFAVVVEGGGAGSAVAAPIAARFLNGLPTTLP
ncbi:penicillin-binding transpeptidase domain-containing protein [Nonomuraea soli]|uniref:Penicillin-binding protein transpeptidase domain-containing protein n=1 Tax=Nonomuraea soli TaxID=1032476 RepID=A0A7W0CKA8_9ACTN|nr:penicillin-binding transpeptidase domain-containing protein [Nonomuraea soli]MBA2892728.1 hypothetical protein [Nonomuraea soli]